MKTLAPMAALVATAALGCQVPASKAPALENTRWHVTASPAAGGRAETETERMDALLFGERTVASQVLRSRGLAATAYTVTPKEGKWLLAARQSHAKVGEVTWSCEIVGDKLSGTMVWKHKGGNVESFRLVGVQAPTLETTCWSIKLTDTSEEKKAALVEDMILFAGHRLTSKAVRAKGFAMCGYNLLPAAGGVWVLEAMQRNKRDKSRLVWAGELKDNTIKGTLTLYDADGGTRSECTFAGSKTDKRVRVKKRGTNKPKKANKNARKKANKKANKKTKEND